MNFAEKLKTLRKQTGLSQEKLAEKMGVSRQAVTKWETDAGLPDIENLVAVSKLFGVPLEELIGPGAQAPKKSDFFYESVTEYDAMGQKPFDIHVGGAKEITLSVTDSEKVRVLLASDTLKTLERDFKVRLDGHDIDVSLQADMTEAQAKQALHVFIGLPKRFLAHTELEAVAHTLRICGFCDQTLEFDGKVNRVLVEDSTANIELNSLVDMDVTYTVFAGRLEINQLSSTSKLNIPAGTAYSVRKKGLSTKLSFERDGKPVEKVFSGTADHLIELKGMHSEVVINEYTALPEGGRE